MFILKRTDDYVGDMPTIIYHAAVRNSKITVYVVI